jgi:hypothetical protein
VCQVRSVTLARALRDVEAPPFDSLLELSAALTRQEQGDRSAVLRDLYARAAATPLRIVGLDGERRRRGPSVAELRRQLREADEELFGQLNAIQPAPEKSPGSEVLGSLELRAESVDVTPTAQRHTAWRRIVGAAAAATFAFGVGYAIGEMRTTRRQSHTVVTRFSAAELLSAPLAVALPQDLPHEIPATRSRHGERRGLSPAWRGGQRQGLRTAPASRRIQAGVLGQSGDNGRPVNTSVADVQALADQILRAHGQPSGPPMGIRLAWVGQSPMNPSVADVQVLADHIFRARGEPLR